MTYIWMATAPRGVGALRGEEPFPAAAKKGLANTTQRSNLGKATARKLAPVLKVSVEALAV